jgi:hypothetical protein
MGSSGWIEARADFILASSPCLPLSRRFDHHLGGLPITQNHCNPSDKK